MDLHSTINIIRRRSAVLILLAVWGAYFLPPLFANHTYVFRDSGSFYRPLTEWTARQWRMNGKPPVWNDRNGIGVPVVGDATSAVFYPGQLIFAAPLSASRRLTLYVGLHALLAMAGAYRLARSWKRSRNAAGLCGLAYAFGGSILFQQCNIVFLVGAAWLPWSLRCLSQTWSRPKRGWLWIAGWSATLAMMVLGGDPQLAYHVVLLAGLSLLMRMWQPGAASLDGSPPHGLIARCQNGFASPLTMVAGGAFIALMLAAAQIAPAWSWSQESTRARRDEARSIYELVQDQTQPDAGSFVDGMKQLVAEPPRGHARQAYWFSVGPWRWMEWIWPNISGRLFPENSRWLTVLPAEGRTWSPSLYMGLPIIVFACMGLSWRNRRRRWLTLVAVFSLLASLGWYGAGWFLNEVLMLWNGPSEPQTGVGPQFGGLYWLHATLLPGYAMFRYPAKWLTITSLAIAMLGAGGWDRFMDEPFRWRRFARAAMISLGLISLLSAVGVVWYSDAISEALQSKLKRESFFGPFSAFGACREIRFAFLHCAVVSICMAALLRGDAPNRRRQLAVLALAAAELGFANAWLTPHGPDALWRPPTSMLAELDDMQNASLDSESPQLLRIYRGQATGWLPDGWASNALPDRLSDAVRWNVATAYPNLHLIPQQRLAVLNAPSSIESARWSAWIAVARRYGWPYNNSANEAHPQALKPFGVQAYWLPTPMEWPAPTETAFVGRHTASNFWTWREPHVWPRGWLVEESVVLAPPPARARRELIEYIDLVLRPHGEWRDFRRQVVLESSAAESESLSALAISPEAASQDNAQLLRDDGSQLQFSIEATRPRWFVVGNHYAAGWRCRVLTSRSRWMPKVHRVNGVMQGVFLPAGKHELTLSYEPRSLWAGCWISGMSWIVLSIFSFFSTFQRAAADDTEQPLADEESSA